jgi:hypothetical protein
VSIGSNVLVGEGPAISIGCKPMLSLGLSDAGGLELSLDLVDRSGNLLASIDRNEWLGSATAFDIRAGYRWLQVRQAARDILLEVDASHVPVRLRAELWYNGTRVALRPEGICLGGTRLPVSFSGFCFVGTCVCLDRWEEGDDTARVAFAVRPYDGIEPSWPHLQVGCDEAAIEKAIATYRSLRGDAPGRLAAPGSHAAREDRLQWRPTSKKRRG